MYTSGKGIGATQEAYAPMESSNILSYWHNVVYLKFSIPIDLTKSKGNIFDRNIHWHNIVSRHEIFIKEITKGNVLS